VGIATDKVRPYYEIRSLACMRGGEEYQSFRVIMECENQGKLVANAVPRKRELGDTHIHLLERAQQESQPQLPGEWVGGKGKVNSGG